MRAGSGGDVRNEGNGTERVGVKETAKLISPEPDLRKRESVEGKWRGR